MSFVQTLGVLIVRAAMVVMFVVIAMFAILVASKTAGFAWTQADGIGMGLWGVPVAVGLEIFKNWLPVVVYNQRHDAPRMATWAFGAFIILAVMSYAATMYYENMDGTNRMSNILLFVGHIFAAGGPVVWINASKWIEELPTDGLPRAPITLQPAPMQQDAIPGPQHSLGDGFIEWGMRMISRDPDGQIAPGKALEHYNAWASANGYPTAEARDFDPLMTTAVEGMGGYASGGFFMGVSLASEPHYLAVH